MEEAYSGFIPTVQAFPIESLTLKDILEYFAWKNDVLSPDSKTQINSLKIYGRLCAKFGFMNGQLLNINNLKTLVTDATVSKQMPAIDFTFPAPKSVSIAYLVTDEDLRILEAHEKAVLSCLGEMEDLGFKFDAKMTGNMAYLLLTEGCNKGGEPHLHTHSIFLNIDGFAGEKLIPLPIAKMLDEDTSRLLNAMYLNYLQNNYQEIGRELVYVKDVNNTPVLHDVTVSFAQVLALSKHNTINDYDD